MKKKSLLFFLFQLCIYVGVLFFSGMLYWSSLLLEEQMLEIKTTLLKLQEELLIKSKIEPSLGKSDIKIEDLTFSKISRKWMDPSFPNLLKEDPFFDITLPQLLGKAFLPKGVLRLATVGKPMNLHPLSQWSEVVEWYQLCVPSIAKLKFGFYEEMSADLAIKVEERRSLKTEGIEYWVHLRENVFWAPLNPKHFSKDIQLAPHFLKQHPVTAHDFKFGYEAVMNPYLDEPGAVSRRPLLEGIQEIEVLDDYTFVVRWKTEAVLTETGKKEFKAKYMARALTMGLKPLPCFVYQYYADGKKIIEEESKDAYLSNAVWPKQFSSHFAKNVIVGCGPWLFDGISDRMIAFRRNPDYYFPYGALVNRMEISFKSTPEAIWQDFKSGFIDIYKLQPPQKMDLDRFLNSEPYFQQKKEGKEILQLEYLNRVYYYIGWNLTKPHFKSKKVRQALAMAVDRQRMIAQNLFGMGLEVTGTFYRYSPAYDPSIHPWPYDPFQAKRLLEEEGWTDSDGDGILDKEIEGKRVPFRFNLTYFVKNPTTKSICEGVSTALKEIGIDCVLNGVDLADLSSIFDDKSFDAFSLGWALGTPPEDPKDLWYSSGAKQKGSSNAIGFINQEADRLIDLLEYEYDPKKRIWLYHKFDRLLYDEAPYLFLYSPKTTLLYRSYVKNVFIPKDRQDLIPGAVVNEPDTSLFFLMDSP